MEFAEQFASALEEKWNNPEGEEKKRFPSFNYNVWVEHGKKYDRIFSNYSVGDRPAAGGSVHAFVEIATGRLAKAAGLAKPAMWNGELASRWNLSDPDQFSAALAAADTCGGYLYKG